MKKPAICSIVILVVFSLNFAGCDFLEKIQRNNKKVYQARVKENMYIGQLVSFVIYDTAGVAIRVKSKNYFNLRHRTIKEMVLVCQDAKGDTSYFEVLALNSSYYMFSKPTVPSLHQLAIALRPGIRIRIPSYRPLSKFAKVLSKFIYIGNEKIPYIDYDPKG